MSQAELFDADVAADQVFAKLPEADTCMSATLQDDDELEQFRAAPASCELPEGSTELPERSTEGDEAGEDPEESTATTTATTTTITTTYYYLLLPTATAT